MIAAALITTVALAPLATTSPATGDPGPGPAPKNQPVKEPRQSDVLGSQAPAGAGLPGYGVYHAPVEEDVPQPVASPPAGPASIAKDQQLADALASLAPSKLEAIAAQNGLSVKRLTELSADKTAYVGTAGGLFYVDEPVDPAKLKAAGLVPEEATPHDGPFPLGDTFFLHSKPGASKVLFMDFDGYALPSGTAWKGGASYNAPAFDSSGDGAAFNSTELSNVQNIWQRVAEDYAALDIDVTTQYPGYSAINRSSSSDTTYGGRVVITGATNTESGICSSCGGVSYVGVIDLTGSTHDYYQPSWVFAPNVSGNKNTAEATSHEFGHAAGLSHDGTSSASYYTGHNQWAPIMGVGYYRPVVQFSKGEYTDANNGEDDYAVMGANGLALRADDHGSTFGSGTWIYNGNTANGIIERDTDGDMFQFTSCGGPVTIRANPSPASPNLDARLFLYNSSNGYVASDDPLSATSSTDVASGMSASITTSLTYGQTYQVWVDRASRLPASTGYSAYGSRGFYQVSIDQQADCDLYAWVDNGGAPGSYTITNSRWANPSGGGAPTVNHSSAGTYSVTWPSANVTGGNVQVTSTTVGVTCNSAGWSSSTAYVSCRDSAGGLRNTPFSIYYTLDDSSAFVWASSPSTATYTPSTVWSHNPSGKPITINRSSAGRYSVVFPGFTGADGGNVQVTAYNSGAVRCVSAGWSDTMASVSCFDGAGTAVDSLFNLSYTKRQSSGYAWADQPSTVAAYAPASYWSQNPTGGAVSIKRQAVGRYKATFTGLSGGRGNVQVSGYSGNNTCVVRAWSNNAATIACTDAAGVYVDSYYNVLFVPADPIVCQGLPATVDLNVGDRATTGNDVVYGTKGNDVIDVLAGNDVVCSGDGDDGLTGGDGNDRFNAGNGNDVVSGTAGADTLLGYAGNDILRGGDGTDNLDGGIGDDSLAGEAGPNDRCTGGDGTDTQAGGCEVISSIP